MLCYVMLWDHRRLCGPSVTETSLFGTYLCCNMTTYIVSKLMTYPKVSQQYNVFLCYRMSLCCNLQHCCAQLPIDPKISQESILAYRKSFLFS